MQLQRSVEWLGQLILHCDASTILWLICVVAFFFLLQSWASFKTAQSHRKEDWAVVGVGSSTLSPVEVHSSPRSGCPNAVLSCLAGYVMWLLGQSKAAYIREGPFYWQSRQWGWMLPEIQLPADCWSRPLGQGSKDGVKQLEAFAAVSRTVSFHRWQTTWASADSLSSIFLSLRLKRSVNGKEKFKFWFFFFFGQKVKNLMPLFTFYLPCTCGCLRYFCLCGYCREQLKHV